MQFFLLSLLCHRQMWESESIARQTAESGILLRFVNPKKFTEYHQPYPLTVRPQYSALLHTEINAVAELWEKGREREVYCRLRSLRNTACSKLPYTAVCANPTAATQKQIDSLPHRQGVRCGEEMTNNPRKRNGKSLCSCQCHLAIVWLFKGDGDKQRVSTTEQRGRDNGGNVRDSSQITERKHCNKLKA